MRPRILAPIYPLEAVNKLTNGWSGRLSSFGRTQVTHTVDHSDGNWARGPGRKWRLRQRMMFSKAGLPSPAAGPVKTRLGMGAD
jgi:hypothetical protein